MSARDERILLIPQLSHSPDSAHDRSFLERKISIFDRSRDASKTQPNPNFLQNMKHVESFFAHRVLRVRNSGWLFRGEN
jgi:hypothetical protein